LLRNKITFTNPSAFLADTYDFIFYIRQHTPVMTEQSSKNSHSSGEVKHQKTVLACSYTDGVCVTHHIGHKYVRNYGVIEQV